MAALWTPPRTIEAPPLWMPPRGITIVRRSPRRNRIIETPWSSPWLAAFTFIGAASGQRTTTGLSITTVQTLSTQVGDLLVCGIIADQSVTFGASPITDSQSNTWTNRGGPSFTGAAPVCGLYESIVASGKSSASHTVTFTVTGGANQFESIAVLQFRPSGTAAVDVAGAAGASTYYGKAGPNAGTVTSPSLTNTSTQGVYCAVGGTNGNATENQDMGTLTVPTNGKIDVATGQPICMGYLIVTSAAARTVTYNSGGGTVDDLSVMIGSWKDSGGAAVDPFPADYPWYMLYPKLWT